MPFINFRRSRPVWTPQDKDTLALPTMTPLGYSQPTKTFHYVDESDNTVWVTVSGSSSPYGELRPLLPGTKDEYPPRLAARYGPQENYRPYIVDELENKLVPNRLYLLDPEKCETFLPGGQGGSRRGMIWQQYMGGPSAVFTNQWWRADRVRRVRNMAGAKSEGRDEEGEGVGEAYGYDSNCLEDGRIPLVVVSPPDEDVHAEHLRLLSREIVS